MTWDPYDGKSVTQSASDQYKVRNLLKELWLCDFSFCMLVIQRRDLEVTDGTNNVTWLMYRRKDQQRAFWNRTSYIWYFFVWGHQMSLIVWTWVLSFSILFQFCKAAPEDLPICDPLERMPSYISYQYYDRIHGLKMLLQDKMKCVCPNGYNYLDTRYNFVTKGSFDVAIIKYFCLPVSYAIANFLHLNFNFSKKF